MTGEQIPPADSLVIERNRVEPTGLTHAMTELDLDEVGRHMIQARQDIERQRRTVQILNDSGADAKAIRQAEVLLRGLEQQLEVLRDRQNVILDAYRRPKANPEAKAENEPGRSHRSK